MSIGLPAKYSVNILHFIEAMFAVPYRYNKLLDVKTFVKGKEDKRPFVINARYLDLDLHYNQTKWLLLLLKMNKIKGIQVGKGFIFLTSFKEATQIAEEKMINDPYFFLKKRPNFKKGKIPLDGKSKNKDYQKESNYTKSINARLYSFYMGHNIKDIKKEEVELDFKIIRKRNK